MSKYVNHKHGMIIGSDNIFFLKDEYHSFRKYRSIVWAESYKFNEITGVNLMVKTPAQQILWDKVVNVYGDEYYTLQSWVVSWLNDNVGEMYTDWGYHYADKHSMRDKPIFFRRRNDAVKFVKMISKHLDGMRFDR